MKDFLDRVAALSREGRAFAVATVVGRRAPVSAHLGDRAIVFLDGRMEGFVGGACSREIIRRQALEVLGSRQSRLVSIRPDASREEGDSEHVIVPMSCASEGAIDVYVEPIVAARRLAIVGATPVAEALARSARSLDYDVFRFVEPGELADLEPQAALGIAVGALPALTAAITDARGDVAVVVASQGHYDEEALEQVLRSGPERVAYLGLVASRKRAATVRSYLEGRGVQGIATIRAPAGLDLGSRTAADVALSILAEMVQVLSARPGVPHPVPATSDPDATATTAIDPVCGMQVRIAGARHTADVDGMTYYFCCAQCRARFVQDPSAFLPSRHSPA